MTTAPEAQIRALLVDDDVALAHLLDEYLGGHAVTVVHFGDGESALAALDRGDAFDVVLLDVMLPGIDGFEVCKRIRTRHEVPVVMLTARGDDADRIVGLEIGADDYVPKPFNPRELLARVRAVLRRTKATPGTTRIVVGPFTIDVAGHRVERAGIEIPLTSYEFRILVELAKRAGETVPREELAASVRDAGKAKGTAYDPSVDRSLDVHLSRLRQKLEEDPKEPRYLKTVRGIGYVFARPS